MTTISTVCRQFFERGEYPKELLPSRAARRNLARILYRQQRRPGLVNPSEPGERLERQVASERCVNRPKRHVYKFHHPKEPKRKILMSMIPRLDRSHRKLV